MTLAVLGTWARRGPLAFATATYVLVTLTTLAFHAYNLDRHIVSVSIVKAYLVNTYVSRSPALHAEANADISK